jgi:zinc D-Ala-D-Ala dipeptidase
MSRYQPSVTPQTSNSARPQRFRTLLFRFLLSLLVLGSAAEVLASELSSLFSLATPQSAAAAPAPKPPDVPQAWKPWIGEYGAQPASVPNTDNEIVSEKDGSIVRMSRHNADNNEVSYKTGETFAASGAAPSAHGLRLGKSGKRELVSGDTVLPKISQDFNSRAQVVIHPVKPVAEVRKEALAAKPPHEDGNFRKPELVELTTLDPAIHLDIRYATTNDFLGTPVYTQARAFLQKPAAEAMARALQKLKQLGYGLLIHDGYRPWYVTKIFWDATPPEGKIFVADPSQGSRHNRGCAVDLTLYDLASGKPIEMPGTYDEMSPRSFPDYPGGTSLERWSRDLLRSAMESEGFTVYEHEWWHFDYKDWREYPILNIRFEDLKPGNGLAATK